MNVSNIHTLSAAGENARIPQTQLGKNDFLKILAAQIQYQDPLSGGNNTEYIAQLAQFAALEQIQNLNNSITEMMYLQVLQYGSQLVGKTVTINDGIHEFRGVVERVSLQNGDISVIVNDSRYKLYQIEEIGGEPTGEMLPDGEV